ncbi:MAG: helix-turn-helix transcriptional regulator [Lachnospiraceae bacterium]
MTEIQIGTQIALLRKKRKITQADLANSLSVSNQAVSKWELGDSLR